MALLIRLYKMLRKFFREKRMDFTINEIVEVAVGRIQLVVLFTQRLF